MRTAVVAGACWLALFGSGFAACGPPKAIRFPAGASAAELTGDLVRTERDCFTIDARKAQTLAVSQPKAGDPSVAIQIYQPPWHIGTDEDGLVLTGAALKGAEDGDSATRWRGKLPVSGSYLLVVGPIAGNASYRLHVEIR